MVWVRILLTSKVQILTQKPLLASRLTQTTRLEAIEQERDALRVKAESLLYASDSTVISNSEGSTVTSRETQLPFKPPRKNLKKNESLCSTFKRNQIRSLALKLRNEARPTRWPPSSSLALKLRKDVPVMSALY